MPIEEKSQPIKDENTLVKPDHNGLILGVALRVVEPLKQSIAKRIANAVSNPCPLPELSGEIINVKEIEDASEAYPDFLSKKSSTTLIRSPMMTGKTKCPGMVIDSID
nr:12442_t:CDS:2 [Entrophospora candida]